MTTRYNIRSKRNRSMKHFHVGYFGVTLLAIILLIAALEVTNTTHFFHKQAVVTTTPIGTNPPQSVTPNSTTPDNTQAKLPPKVSSSSNQNSQILLSPNQSTYVSTHTANQATTEQSVCVTSPGATCTITFTLGSVTRTLTAKKTDSSGAAYWQWKPSQIGLTSGYWTVAAHATLDTQSKTSSDVTPLKVL